MTKFLLLKKWRETRSNINESERDPSQPFSSCLINTASPISSSGSSQITVSTGWDLQFHPNIHTNF